MAQIPTAQPPKPRNLYLFFEPQVHAMYYFYDDFAPGKPLLPVRKGESRISKEPTIAPLLSAKPRYGKIHSRTNRGIETDTKSIRNVRMLTYRRPHKRDQIPLSHHSLGHKEYFVEGDVKDILVEALPDSGASKSFISPLLASSLGLRPTTGAQLIALPNKTSVKSQGLVEVPWRFAGEKTLHWLHCWILPGCLHDIILGNTFLTATKTFTEFFQRIKSRLRPFKSSRLALLGRHGQRLWGYFNNHMTAALPDTGSDLMLVSSDYARKLDLLVDKDWSERVKVEFADGTTAWTSGIVHDVSWTVGATSTRCDFYVLDDLCVDVILNNDYLFETNAFSNFRRFISDTDLLGDTPELYNIRLLGRYSDALHSLVENFMEDMASPEPFSDEMIQRELARRDHIRDGINALPEAEQEEAKRVEAERQQRWQQIRETHRSSGGSHVVAQDDSESQINMGRQLIQRRSPPIANNEVNSKQTWLARAFGGSIPLRISNRN